MTIHIVKEQGPRKGLWDVDVNSIASAPQAYPAHGCINNIVIPTLVDEAIFHGLQSRV